MKVQQAAAPVATAQIRSKGGVAPTSAGPVDSVATGQNGAAAKVKKTDGATTQDPHFFRPPQQAVTFCDKFTAAEGLSVKNVLDKEDLMVTGGLKMARCAPHLMMADNLGPLADDVNFGKGEPPVVWIQGDAHFGNVGVIRDQKGHGVFGLNDFDMACKGSPAMDLGRCAFSLQRFMIENNIDPTQAHKVVDTFIQSYLKEMKDIDKHGVKPPWLTADEVSGPVKPLLDKADKIQRKDWIKKYAEKRKDGEWHFVHSSKVEEIKDLELVKKITDAVTGQYENSLGTTSRMARPIKVLGVAQKLQSGGSSQGQPRYYVLVANADPDKPPIMLEVKEELPPPLAGWDPKNPKAAVPASKPLWTGNLAKANAKQVVQGQKAMGGCPNELTGYTSMDDVSYLVREREACKAALLDTDLTSVKDMTSLAEQLGKIYARGHGRSEEQAAAILKWADDPDTFSQKAQAYAMKTALQAGGDCDAYRAAHPEASKEAGVQIPDLGD